MMSRYWLRTICLVSLLLQISGCMVSPPPTDPRLICKSLKRQYSYNASNNNIEAVFTTDGQKEDLVRKMREMHCDRYR